MSRGPRIFSGRACWAPVQCHGRSGLSFRAFFVLESQPREFSKASSDHDRVAVSICRRLGDSPVGAAPSKRAPRSPAIY